MRKYPSRKSRVGYRLLTRSQKRNKRREPATALPTFRDRKRTGETTVKIRTDVYSPSAANIVGILSSYPQ